MGYLSDLSSFADKKRFNRLNKRIMGGQLTSDEYGEKRAKDYLKALGGFQLFGFPDIILGFIPLYTVQFYEVAISQDILKYRAVGSQFLAKQKGGNFALRVDAQLNDSSSQLTLTGLQKLYRNGQPREEINDGLKKVVGLGSGNSAFNIVNQKPISPNANNPDNLVMSDDVAVVSPNNKKWMLSTYHSTFTAMTRDTVLFDMFIESIIYWRTLDSDPNTIHISLLLRKFTPPRRIIGNNTRDVKSAGIQTLDDKIKKIPIPIDAGSDEEAVAIQEQVVNERIAGWKIGNKLVSHTYDRTVRYIEYEDAYPKKSDKIDLVYNGLHSIGMMRLIYDDWGLSPKRKSIRDHGLLNWVYKVTKLRPVRNQEIKQPQPKVTVENVEYVKLANPINGQIIKYKNKERTMFFPNYKIECNPNKLLEDCPKIKIYDTTVVIKGKYENNVLTIYIFKDNSIAKYNTRKDFYITMNGTHYIFIKNIMPDGYSEFNIYISNGEDFI